MTAKAFLTLLVRRWSVLALIAMVTVAGMYAVMRQDVSVYWTRVTVVFVPPVTADTVGNVFEGSDPSLVYFAAAVEQRVNGAMLQPRLSSSAATLFGAGVRQGQDVSLVNSGGQWQTNFNRPMLNVEVVDSTPEAVQQRLDAVLGQIERAAQSMQTEAGTQRTRMITIEVAPPQPTISHIAGNAKRAAVGVGLLGLGVGLAIAFLLDGLLAGRRRHAVAPRRALVLSSS